ncbi:hypothetical protein ABTN03_18950, partial [Acinetobacter baumannii]
NFMDYYEKTILVVAVPVFAWLGWFHKPVRLLMVGMTILAFSAIALYNADPSLQGAEMLARAEKSFFLKYFLASQSAILWMSALFFLSTLF